MEHGLKHRPGGSGQAGSGSGGWGCCLCLDYLISPFLFSLPRKRRTEYAVFFSHYLSCGQLCLAYQNPNILGLWL